MKKRLAIVLSLTIIVVIVVSAFATVELYNSSAASVASKKPFYVGVTYCGNSTTEAEQLMDKVKSYTNLFVLDSGILMLNIDATEQIGDYAVNSGLNIILYYSSNNPASTCVSLLNLAQTRWGSHFLGLYYNDEPGGKMLDTQVNLSGNNKEETITKNPDGSVTLYKNANQTKNGALNSTLTGITFFASGEIRIQSAEHIMPSGSMTQTIITSNGNEPTGSDVSNGNGVISINNEITYSTNGTITYSSTNGDATIGPLTYQPNGSVQDQNGAAKTDQGTIAQFVPYQELWDSRPLQTYAEAANAFVNSERHTLVSIGNQSSVKLFTSDYALDWFDYEGGYDVVLTQLGWNQSTTKNIALVRGTANMHDKSWGVMIAWQNLSAPYLQRGSQMYNEMHQAYESGAEYVVVFNYSPNSNGTGLLQNEHFAALQKFWTDVVQNPRETNSVTAQDALVLPQNYGWGMRNPQDTIWGLWNADNSSLQIWTQLQSKLAQYGSRLDIVYDDPAYPVVGKYSQIYYWNQTS